MFESCAHASHLESPAFTQETQCASDPASNFIAEDTIEHGMGASLTAKMELAQGVLDGIGDLHNIKLRSGRQALLSRLEQVMASTHKAGAPAPQPPSDPAAWFAGETRRRLGPQLEHCEETWLPGSDVPVVLAIVREPVDAQRPAVEEMFNRTLWRGSRPTLEVLGASAWKALRNLASTGMITIHTRATRPLLPPDGAQLPPPLTAEQLARIEQLRTLAAKKRRAAKALAAEDLPEEADALIHAAMQAEQEAAAIESGSAP